MKAFFVFVLKIFLWSLSMITKLCAAMLKEIAEGLDGVRKKL